MLKNRYGFDRLSFFLLVVSVLFLLEENLYLISIALIMYVIYRMLSKNFSKRKDELQTYLLVNHKIRMFFKKMLREPKVHYNKIKVSTKRRMKYKYIKCNLCRKEMRVPRGKGKIVVTCPHCANKFDAKT